MNRTAAPQLPKYWQLVERFRTQIQSGELSPGDRLPSIAEMKTQGVSRPVMDKVHQILEQEGLILRQPGSGTFVCEPKTRETTGILGVSGWGFDFGAQSSYWSEVLSGLREGAAAHGMQLLLLDHGSSKGWEKADGVLLCDYDAHQVLQHVPAQLPCVSILVPIENMASVFADEYAAALAATEYLITQGHRSVGYMYRSDKFISPRRLKGYEDALRAAGIEPDPKWKRKMAAAKVEYGAQFIEAGNAEMKRWFVDGWEESGCSALIDHNDEVAIGVMAAFRDSDIIVPEQVSVVGFDGLQIGDYVAPRLTTMVTPLRAIGVNAVEMLVQQIAADTVGVEHKSIAMQLRERESVTARES